MTFKTWLEGWEQYGFRDNDPKEKSNYFGSPDPENPVDTFDSEYLINMLSERNIGPLQPKSDHIHEVRWGDQPGSLRLAIQPGYGVYLQRLGKDLQGESLWYTKKYFQINRQGYGGYEEVVTQELYESLENIYKTPEESAKSEFPDLQNFIFHMANRIKSTMRPIFYFDRIHKIHDHRYQICLNVRGNGVQSPGQMKIARNYTEVNFLPDKGVIRMWNTNQESKVGRDARVEIAPDNASFTFFPTQAWDEICDPITTVLRFY